MIANLVFYQLGLIVLVWVFLTLSWLWPSAPAVSSTDTTHARDATYVNAPRRPNPFRVSPGNPLARLVSRQSEAPGSSHLLLHPRRFLRHEAVAVTSTPLDHSVPICDCRYGGWLGLGNITSNGHPSGGPWRQPHCTGLLGLFPRDPRHPVAWQTRRARPAGMGRGRVGRKAWASARSPGSSRWTRTRCCSGWSRWRTMPRPFLCIS